MEGKSEMLVITIGQEFWEAGRTSLLNFFGTTPPPGLKCLCMFLAVF